MRRIFFTLLIWVPIAAAAQDSDTTTAILDVLKSPSSPAFNILGVSPSNVERPTDVNAFRLSVQNATSDFTRLPLEYSVEAAPAILVGIGNQTLSSYNSSKFKDVFWQSLSVSAALNHGNRFDEGSSDSVAYSKLGVGLKFSIIRPNWSDKTKALYQDLREKQRIFVNRYSIGEIDDEILMSLEAARKQNERNNSISDQRRKAVRDSLKTEIDNRRKMLPLFDSIAFFAVKKAAEKFKIERVGPSLDFAAGTVVDFPDNSFDYSLLSRAGAWLTGGYEGGNNGFSGFAVIRYLYQPDKIFADDKNTIKTDNISTLDFGGRALWTCFEGKYTIGVEGVYRSVLNGGVIDPTWRFTFNTEYDYAPNRKITFSLGKNFDGTVTTGGNLIAALNLIAGFGSAKKIE
jgi:hypothetical protein